MKTEKSICRGCGQKKEMHGRFGEYCNPCAAKKAQRELREYWRQEYDMEPPVPFYDTPEGMALIQKRSDERIKQQKEASK